MIPNNGEVVITDLPVGGCRRYDSLECLSHVEYQGRVLKAYWKYTNTTSLQEFLVEDFRCQFRRNCKSPGIGWLSARGIYRKGKSYYNVLRLGRVSEKAAVGLFTCNFEEDNEDPVSVNIVPCESKDKTFFIEKHSVLVCLDFYMFYKESMCRFTCTWIVPIVLYPILTLYLSLCLCLVYISNNSL